MSYLDLAKKVLEIANKPLTYKEIWNLAIENGLDKKLTSIGKTPEQTIAARLYVNIRDREDSEFIMVSRRPTKFWLKNKDCEKNLQVSNQTNTMIEKIKKSYNERNLHPLLVKYLKESDFDCFSKTIMHEKSKKGQSGEDRWNYPDIVAVHFPFNDWKEKETLELTHNLNKINYKIYSFELKVDIDFSNLKEYYFQAVSNSSFANEGYLVVFEDIDEEVLNEIRRLNQSFGIGLIKLEVEALESRIILPSFERNLDFKTLDMLINKNKDFKKFICDLNKDIQINDRDRIIKENYDKILSDEEMEKYLIDNKIISQQY